MTIFGICFLVVGIILMVCGIVHGSGGAVEDFNGEPYKRRAGQAMFMLFGGGAVSLVGLVICAVRLFKLFVS